MYNVDITPWFYLRTNEASQTGPSYSRTSCDVVIPSQHDPGTFKLVTKKDEYIFLVHQVVQSLLGTS